MGLRGRRCDLAEMQLRTNKFKEAQATAEPFVKDAVLIKSRYRGMGLYHHGYAAFAQKDYLTAGRSLSQLAPFQDPVTAPHVRYLLVRVHHLSDERPEAVANYEAVLTGFDQQKKAAAQALQNPAAFKDNADEKLRLEALTKNPPPDYVARASFYWGVLLCEDGRSTPMRSHVSPRSRDVPRFLAHSRSAVSLWDVPGPPQTVRGSDEDAAATGAESRPRGPGTLVAGRRLRSAWLTRTMPRPMIRHSRLQSTRCGAVPNAPSRSPPPILKRRPGAATS